MRGVSPGRRNMKQNQKVTGYLRRQPIDLVRGPTVLLTENMVADRLPNLVFVPWRDQGCIVEGELGEKFASSAELSFSSKTLSISSR